MIFYLPALIAGIGLFTINNEPLTFIAGGNLKCPSGYLTIKADRVHTFRNFCVSSTEMKNYNGTPTPKSGSQ